MKVYIEALENRLEETENVLLQVLSILDESTVELAFQNAKVFRRGTSRLYSTASADISSSAEASKSILVAHWRDYPLTTANEVQQWVKEAVEGDHVQPTLIASNTESSNVLDVPATPQGSVTAKSTPISVDDEGSTTTTFMDDSEIQLPVQSISQPWESSSHPHQHPEMFSTPQLMPASSQMYQRDQKTDNAMGLSEDFKKQYIW